TGGTVNNGMSTTALERTPTGRFAAGNKAAVGRPHPQAARVYELRTALLAAVDSDTVVHVVKRPVGLVADEDPAVAIKAAELLLNRIYGKPRESIELDVHPPVDPTAGHPINLDATDVAILERLRQKLTTIVSNVIPTNLEINNTEM